MFFRDYRGLKLDRVDFSHMNLLQSRFSDYLNDSVFTSRAEKSLIEHILANGDACIFGGVIRDFILDRDAGVHRDVDLVIYKIDTQLEKYLHRYLIKKNRFGGYKLYINDKSYDLWTLNDTWALRQYSKTRHSLKILPHTSFFNVNAIIFSLCHNKFFMHKKFRQSIEDKVLDIVYEGNPCPELCIIKTFQHVNELGMSISQRVVDYLNRWFNDVKEKLIDIQVSHFGHIRYSIEELERFACNAEVGFACQSCSAKHIKPDQKNT